MKVDNDNKPATENIPDLTSTTERHIRVVLNLCPGQIWSWNGFDERKKENFIKIEPKINGLSGIALEGVCFAQKHCYITMFMSTACDQIHGKFLSCMISFICTLLMLLNNLLMIYLHKQNLYFSTLSFNSHFVSLSFLSKHRVV